ncbi:DUF4389 domain-containing protein [Agaribacterium haliotis]|uniref:DUF4389 domain-containing protein n=1 Tax=Agaribacterium haliotis TaxID=2013869 RepID=UPI00195CF580|nr:DUF4389 domain-containing protein [Agaribacterium haliotis]
MDEQLKKNISAVHIWIRLVYMLLFAVVLYAAMAVFWVLVLVQFMFALIAGKPKLKLAQFADVLCQYINQCLRFVSFSSEEKPFPFSDLPVSDIVDSAEPEGEPSSQA